MEIHYLWIKDYKNIKEQGFNVSSKYQFDFSYQTKTLTMIENDEFIKDFFGKRISNVTAVVGENGTGKSNILDLAGVSFFITEYKGDFYLVNEDKITISKIAAPVSIKKVNQLDFKDTIILRYSNHFEGFTRDNITRSLSYRDISTDGALTKNYFTSPHEEKELVQKYRLYEVFTQSNFVLALPDVILPFRTPTSISISTTLRKEFQLLNEQIKELESFRSNKDLERELIILQRIRQLFLFEIQATKRISSKKSKTFLKEMAYLQFQWAIFLNFLNSYPANSEGSGLEPLFASVKWNDKALSTWIEDFFYYFLKEYQKPEFYKGDKYYKQYINWSNNMGPFLFEAKKIFAKSDNIEIVYDERSHLFDNLPGSFAYEKQITASEIKINIHLTDRNAWKPIQNCFYELYKKIIWGGRIDSTGFLKFEWRNMSTGELNLLSLFSRIHAVNLNIDAINNSRKNDNENIPIDCLTLILDEPDLGLHPDWQRTILNQIIKALPLLFNNIKSTQIIIATHSPFIVSDLPLSNLIFLQKDKNHKCLVISNPFIDKKQTFASNIHSLFTDSFFMKDGLIGDFAKERINEIIDELQSNNSLSEERRDVIKRTINQVGEPLIRRKLIQLYEDKYRLSVADQIGDIVERVKNLEAKNNDKNKKR